MGNYVTLKVYDVIGREVQTLVKEHLNTGVYTIEWNASEHASGVYFYRLKAGDFKESIKMVIIK